MNFSFAFITMKGVSSLPTSLSKAILKAVTIRNVANVVREEQRFLGAKRRESLEKFPTMVPITNLKHFIGKVLITT